jgi:hypothetical protein
MLRDPTKAALNVLFSVTWRSTPRLQFTEYGIPALGSSMTTLVGTLIGGGVGLPGILNHGIVHD